MVTPYIRSQLNSGIVRLRVTPDEPAEGPPPIVEQRPRGSRLPHTDLMVAKVRHLIEHTTLTTRQIQAKTGVVSSTISVWARDGKWVRPLGAPQPWDRMPTYRASRRVKLRKLAGRLEALAERWVRELEQSPSVEIDTLMQALQVLKMARLEAQGNRRRRPVVGPTYSGAWAYERDKAIRTALKEMRRGGVDLDRAPKEAMDLLIDANTPVEDVGKIRLPRGGRRRSRNTYT
jgi:hypothetical protein